MGNVRTLLVVVGLAVLLFTAGVGSIEIYNRWLISLAARPLVSEVIPISEQ